MTIIGATTSPLAGASVASSFLSFSWPVVLVICGILLSALVIGILFGFLGRTAPEFDTPDDELFVNWSDV